MRAQKLISPACLVLLAIVIIILTPLPARGQNVPATAREAARLPQYEERLAHPSMPARAPSRAGNKACSPVRPGDGVAKGSPQGYFLYANGPIDGICDIQGCTADAWTINFGYTVTDSIPVSGGVGGATFAFWLFPGDTLTSLDWALGTTPFGSDIAQGTASGANLTQQFISSNQYGYNIESVTISGLSGTVGDRGGA